MTKSMLDYALEYLERGWSVIPSIRGKRQPRVRWSEYRDRLPTEAEIEAWWSDRPDDDIVLVTGEVSGIVVVDIDLAKGGKIEGHGDSGCIVRTPGGYHVYHRHPGGIVRNSVSCTHEGIDVRGDGGIAYLPPSVHPSGERYAWIDQGEPSEVPDWVLERDHRRQRAKRGQGPIDERGQPERWVSETAEQGAGEGRRNDTLARMAGVLAGRKIPSDIAMALLSAWNQRCSPPLGSRELRRTVESIYRTEARKDPFVAAFEGRQVIASDTADKHKKTSDERPVMGPEPSIATIEIGNASFRATRFAGYMAKHTTSGERWMLENWLPMDTIAMMVAPPGSFKTWIEFDIAVSLASGLPFLNGVRPQKTGPVLMVQQEDAHAQTVDRIMTIACTRQGIRPPRSYPDGTFVVEFPGDIPIFFHEEASLRFDDIESMKGMWSAIESIEPVLTVIDPLYSAAKTEGYMSESVAKMMALKRIRTMGYGSFLITHHTSKSGTSQRSRQRLWGSQFLNGFLETGLQIHRPRESEPWVIVERHTKASGSMSPVRIDFDINIDACRYAPSVTELTADEVDDLISRGTIASDMSDKLPKRASGDDLESMAPEVLPDEPESDPSPRELSRQAERVLEIIRRAPISAMDLMRRLSMTPGDLELAIDELRGRGDIDFDRGRFASARAPAKRVKKKG